MIESLKNGTEGSNSTIFSFGESGSGKSHTLFG